MTHAERLEQELEEVKSSIYKLEQQLRYLKNRKAILEDSLERSKQG